MYLSRSQRMNDKNRSIRRKRKKRRLLMINLSLLTMIGALLIYYYIDSTMTSQKPNQQAEPPAATQDIDEANEDEVNDAPEAEDEPVEQDTADQEIGQDDEPAAGENNEDDATTDDSPSSSPAPDKGSDQKDSDRNPEADIPVKPAEPAQQSDEDKNLLFHFVGDMMFSGKAEEKLAKEGYAYPYKRLGNLFLKDDLTVGNLESPVTTGGVGAVNKTYVFKSSPKALPELSAAGMDVVSLANNHILDQGVAGLRDTFTHLDSNNIIYVGAGHDENRAFEPQYVTRKGARIALVGVSRVIPDTSWYAGSKKPGVAGAYDPKLAIQAIQTARANADIVIVMVHWGKEKTTVLEEHQRTLSHTFVEAGADLVIGSHPHVLQGLEQYKGKWIAYSTGNFIFTRSTTEQTWETAIFQASCSKAGDCSLKLIPYHAELAQPVPMEEKDARKLLKKVESFSIGGVKLKEDGTATLGP